MALRRVKKQMDQAKTRYCTTESGRLCMYRTKFNWLEEALNIAPCHFAGFPLLCDDFNIAGDVAVRDLSGCVRHGALAPICGV